MSEFNNLYDSFRGWTSFLLPTALVLLAFLAKMYIDRNVDIPKVLKAIAELPADMMFLSMSFCIAYSLSEPKDKGEAMTLLFLLLCVAFVVIGMWRKAEIWFAEKNWRKFFGACVINYFLSILGLVVSVSVNVGKGGV